MRGAADDAGAMAWVMARSWLKCRTSCPFRRRSTLWRRNCRHRMGHPSPQRLLQDIPRRASIGFTLTLAQCIPLPFNRFSTTSLLALSTHPLPMG